MSGQRSDLAAPGQGLTPGPGGGRQCTRNGRVACCHEVHGQRRLSGVALDRFAIVQISGTTSSRPSRRSSLPPCALLLGMVGCLWSHGAIDVFSGSCSADIVPQVRPQLDFKARPDVRTASSTWRLGSRLGSPGTALRLSID
jgi:hypothetical protein